MPANEARRRITGWVVTNWGRKEAALLATITASGSAFLAAISRVASGPSLLLALTAGALVVLFWWITNQPPRTPAKAVGVAVAIYCEDDARERELKSDFIDQLRTNLLHTGEFSNLHLMVYPRWIARTVMESGQALEYQRRSRAHFMVSGSVRVRQTSAYGATFFLALDARVLYSASGIDLERDVRPQFGRILPRMMQIPEKDSIIHFETASDGIALVVRYMTGLAAMVSGYPLVAERLLRDVQAQLPRTAGRYTPARTISRRLPDQLRLLYSFWAQHVMNEWTRTHDVAVLQQGERIIDEMLRLAQSDQAALISKAICAFVLRRDVAEAKRLVWKARSGPSQAWRYSYAFLFAYEGALDRAEKEYKSAFNSKRTGEGIPVEVESFIDWILEVEPDRAHLYYASALINVHVKHDPRAARRDLSCFLARTTDGAFQAQRENAMRLLAEIAEPSDDDLADAIQLDFQLRRTEGQESSDYAFACGYRHVADRVGSTGDWDGIGLLPFSSPEGPTSDRHPVRSSASEESAHQRALEVGSSFARPHRQVSRRRAGSTR